MLILVTGAVFVAISLVSFLILERMYQSRVLKSRIRSFFPQKTDLDLLEQEEQADTSGLKFLRLISQRFRLRNSKRLALELQKAGIQLEPAEFVAFNLVCVILPLVLVIINVRLSTALMLSLFGVIIPQLYVKRRQRQRLAKFSAQIPESLVMISNALKAGYSFLQAMELVAEEMGALIGDEFGRVLKEMNLGATTEDALQSMVKRVDSDDLDLVITAVLIQRQVGGNLSEILDSIAFTIRERIRIKGEIQTLTAQGRISGLVISMLPIGIAIFIFMINPEYVMVMLIDPLGQLMLVLGVLGQIIAAIMIKKIVNIKV